MNEDIKANTVLLIDQNGEKRGEVPIERALSMVRELGLDLVEVSPNARPPVCKILDFGKLKYAEQKKKAEARKKQKTVDVKEIKIRPNIDKHDYDVKIKAMNRFFENGDKVKITIRFKGREMAHKERGMDLMNDLKASFEEITKLEYGPRFEGRQIVMILAPK